MIFFCVCVIIKSKYHQIDRSIDRSIDYNIQLHKGKWIREKNGFHLTNDKNSHQQKGKKAMKNKWKKTVVFQIFFCVYINCVCTEYVCTENVWMYRMIMKRIWIILFLTNSISSQNSPFSCSSKCFSVIKVFLFDFLFRSFRFVSVCFLFACINYLCAWELLVCL